MINLILASSSPYRRELLSRLRIPFTAASPDIDETPLADEGPAETSLRLAIAKAKALKEQFPDSLIIGSDQVALLDREQLGKPGTHERAVEQLKKMRGKALRFHTALCLLNTRTGAAQHAVELTEVRMRDYSDDEIERYLRAETPYDCAGSAKSEGLGIVMIESIRGDDPNALIGLPLIRLAYMLRAEGVATV